MRRTLRLGEAGGDAWWETGSHASSDSSRTRKERRQSDQITKKKAAPSQIPGATETKKIKYLEGREKEVQRRELRR